MPSRAFNDRLEHGGGGSAGRQQEIKRIVSESMKWSYLFEQYILSCDIWSFNRNPSFCDTNLLIRNVKL